MAAPLNPREIWMLEQFCSRSYYEEVRHAWRTMLDGLERAMERYMCNLPANYRSRPRPEQPDMGWGQVVIPNFRSTMKDLDEGAALMDLGDVLGFSAACGVMGDSAGQSRDYPAYWLTDEEGRHFNHWMHEAFVRAQYIQSTYTGSWFSRGLLYDGDEWEGYRVKFPAEWPLYRLNPNVQLKTGERATHTGIFLPDVDDASPQFLYASDKWPVDPARVGTRAATQGDAIEVPTVWTLVERVADTGGGIPNANDPDAAGVRMRCPAGKPCPRAGYWSTPAKANARRLFKQGDVMPDFGADYGATIWQWNAVQE